MVCVTTLSKYSYFIVSTFFKGYIMKILTTLVLLFLIGCSSSADNDSSGQKAPSQLSTEAAKINFPTQMPNDVKSRIAYNEDSFAQFSFADLQNGKLSGGTWTWSYSDDGVTVTISAEQKGNEYHWKFIMNGTHDGQTVTDFVFMEGVSTEDGMSGSWKIYSPDQTEPLMEMSLKTNADGSKEISYSLYGKSDTSTLSFTYVLKSNADGSGSYVLTTGGQKAYEVTWNADGTGTWKDYIGNSEGSW